MTDREVLQVYIGLVPFLAQVCGPGCEIVVHDITDPDHSLVAIENNRSGREPGNPMTDLARSFVERSAYTDADYIAGYPGRGKDLEFLSSTYFIKNEGRLIGLLCVNKDVTAVGQLRGALEELLTQFDLHTPGESSFSENLDNPVTEIMTGRIAEAVARSGIPPARMRMEEKVRIVHQLADSGVLGMKGAVAEAAGRLGISVPTLYRYLNKPALE